MSETIRTTPTEAPLLFLGGFGYGEHRNRVVANQLAQAGHPVLAPPHDTTEKSRKGFIVTSPDGTEQTVSRFETAKTNLTQRSARQVIALSQLDQAATLQAHLEKEVPEGTKVTIIAQSADAQNSLIYAANHPENVENLILVNPAGIVAQPRLDRAAANVLGSVLKSRQRKRTIAPEDLFEQRLTRRQRKLGGFARAASVALSDQRDILHDMRGSKSAPGVAIVLGLEDLIVHPESVIEGLVSANDVDRIVIADMAHGINGRKDILDAITDLLPQLSEAKMARDRGEVPAPLSERISFFGAIPSTVRKRFMRLADELEARTL